MDIGDRLLQQKMDQYPNDAPPNLQQRPIQVDGGGGGGGIGLSPPQHELSAMQQAQHKFASQLLQSNMDDDNMSSISKTVAKQQMDQYRVYMKELFEINSEIDALNTALKARRDRKKDLTEKVQGFMQQNGCEILNLKNVGRIMDIKKTIKKRVPEKERMDRAKLLFDEDNFGKFERLMAEKETSNTSMLKLIRIVGEIA
jgi:galactokinase